MSRKFCVAAVVVAAVAFGGVGGAYAQCARIGQEMCLNGETYRCERTGSELTPIYQNRRCTVTVPSLIGVWRGNGHQSPAGKSVADWSIVMTITNGGGSIDYPSLSCGGTLTQISRNAMAAQFRESISYGKRECIDGGVITVRLFNGRLSWTWFGVSHGKQFNAIAVLTR